MTISPTRGLAYRRARWVELTLLADQQERGFGVLTSPHGSLGGRDLFKGTADMNCRGFETTRIAPWNRTIERPIQLVYAWSVTVPAQAANITAGQCTLSDVGQLLGARIE